MSSTIGEQLRQARQNRQVTLAQAAEATRVKVVYLEALENNELDKLPSKVQGKGYLRLYADFLGVPVQPLLDAWEGKISAPLPSTNTETSIPEEQSRASDEPASKPRTAAREPISQPLPPPSPVVSSQTESHNIFKSIGFTLSERRQSLGLSLEEVEHHTKVRKANLQALEEGRIADLSSSVQARGMLSNYAAFLGLNVDAVLLTFVEGLQTQRTERHPKPAGKGQKPENRQKSGQLKGIRRFLTTDLIIGSSVILVLFFFAIWTASRIASERKSELQATAPSIAEIVDTPGGPMPSVTLAVTQAGIPGELTGESQPQASLEPSQTPTLPIIGSGPVQIYIIAHQRAWIKITADGRELFNGRLIPGNVYAYAARDEIELLTGNAAGVQVIFNQNDIGILGLPGQIFGMIFNLQGAITPTPRFSPTPTQLPTPTPTPQPTPTQPTPTVTQLIP